MTWSGFRRAPMSTVSVTIFCAGAGVRSVEGRCDPGIGRLWCPAVFPVGIDVDGIASLAAAAVTRPRQYRRLCDSIRDRALADRRRPSRLFERAVLRGSRPTPYLLEALPERRAAGLSFCRSRLPSRSDVPEYREICRELEEAAGNINGRFAEFDWTAAAIILNKSFNHRILTGFYRAARLALVTPLRDGMNLVVKEYLASPGPRGSWLADPVVLRRRRARARRADPGQSE